MNYHSDEWVNEKIKEHYLEAKEYFPEENRIVGIFCQGSTNYGLDTEFSDLDTKLIVLPKLDDIIFNRAPVSTTHVRANDEHIDFKDIRLYIQTFRKQNLNFLEILFTKYKIINPMYAEEWGRLVENREAIAHYNKFLAVKAMYGVAMEKYHALEHPYPAKLEVLKKYGYDGKQLHHLLRIEEYLERYINGESYEDCLTPKNTEYLKSVKLHCYSKEEAEREADRALEHINQMSSLITKDSNWNYTNEDVDTILNEVQSKIMRKSLIFELEKGK